MANHGYMGEARMKCFRGREKGFTLVELLVAIPIMGLLGLVIGGVLIQLLRSDDMIQHMSAVRQVQVAGDRVSQDGVQAQHVIFSTANITSDNWSLNMRWSGEWLSSDGTYNNRSENVTYTLVAANGKYNLQRYEIVDTRVGTVNQPRQYFTSIAGQYLDRSQMACQWLASDNVTFIFRAVAVVGDKTEVRTYNVSPRQ